MKKIYTFAALLIAGVIGLGGGTQVFAQNYQIISNDSPYINKKNCSVLNSVGSYYDATNTSEYSIPFGGTISYQGGSYNLVSSDTSDYPTISYTPGTTSTDTIISYRDAVNLSLNNDISIYPTLGVISGTTSSYPSISYQNNQSTIVLSPNVSNTSSCTATVDTDTQVDSNTQYPYANITANDTSGIAYVEYGGSATVNWDSYGMTSCTLDPISLSGTSGEYTLENITSNKVVNISCEISSGFPDYFVSPGMVIIKVLPPTFDYIESYLTAIQPSNNKKVNLKSTDNFIEQARRALEQGSVDRAQAFLQKSVDSIKRQGSKALSAADIDKYASAVNHLIKTLPVDVSIAADGCSATAIGTPGLILQYGANKDMRMGYGNEATIPASGTITEAIYAPNGWQSTAEVVDANGLIYARDTKDVTTDSCPTPPYDPSPYSGYPEKWAVPEVGTVIDDWGFYNKTAESYVAFRITDSGRTFPAGYGNASEWLTKATNDGYTVEYPQAGDIAINTLDVQFGGPIAWHVDSVDESGNYQASAIRSDGNMNWSGGTVEESSYLKYIRLP